MRTFFETLVGVVVENQSDSDACRRANWNGRSEERTHAFNGCSGKKWGTAQRRFSRHGDGGCQPCFLTQVFRRLHPGLLDSNGDKLPFFEHYRFDCCYFAEARIHDRCGFPIEWRNECLIEVENTFDEFVMTLRGLLDVVAEHRVAIFFEDRNKSASLDALSEIFRTPWESYVGLSPFVRDFHLAIVLFPNCYVDEGQFRRDSRYAEWRADTDKWRFVAV